MKEFARAFYHSKPWKKVRPVIINRDKGICQECLRNGKYKPGEIVHHIIPLTPQNINDPAIALNPDNLEYVCKECHEKEHKRIGYGALRKESKEKPRVYFDDDGNVVEIK